VNKNFTPEKICSDFLNNKLKEEVAIDLLLSLIENSEAFNIRAKSIEAISKLNLYNYRIFKFIENCLVSDENALVRSASVKTLAKNFPKHYLLPLNWAIQHDNSVIVLKTIYDVIRNAQDPLTQQLKLNLNNRLTKAYDVKCEAILFLNLEVVYAEFSENPNLKIVSSWHKTMQMLSLFHDFIGLIPRIHYLKGGGEELATLPDSINNIDFFRSFFLSRQNKRSVIAFRERVKLSL